MINRVSITNHLASRMDGRMACRMSLIGLLLIVLQACATNPVTGKRELAMSEGWEASVGPKYHQQIMTQYQVYDDPELQTYVNDIGQRFPGREILKPNGIDSTSLGINRIGQNVLT